MGTEEISEFGVCLKNEDKNGGKPTKQLVLMSLIFLNFLCLKMVFEATLSPFLLQKNSETKKRNKTLPSN